MSNIVEIHNLYKKFQDCIVFEDFSLDIEEHSFTTITGASGSGKSTLLNIIGLLDKGDRGEVELFKKRNIKPFSQQAETILREKIGYLFQNFALVENESVEYNLLIALASSKAKNKKELIQNALEQVGLSGYETKKVFKCSGGEQQRIAIARLLLKPCELILADEPTGSLDKENKDMIVKLLFKLKAMGKTLVVVTHDQEIAKIADKQIRL